MRTPWQPKSGQPARLKSCSKRQKVQDARVAAVLEEFDVEGYFQKNSEFSNEALVESRCASALAKANSMSLALQNSFVIELMKIPRSIRKMKVRDVFLAAEPEEQNNQQQAEEMTKKSTYDCAESRIKSIQDQMQFLLSMVEAS